MKRKRIGFMTFEFLFTYCRGIPLLTNDSAELEVDFDTGLMVDDWILTEHMARSFPDLVPPAEASSRLAGTRDALRIEASNRLFSLADPIADAYPGSRFIFLFRDGRESVRSIWSNPRIDEIMRDKFRFREIARAPTDREISTLEKVCLYWSNINDRILNDLKGKDHLFLSFEDLITGRIDALQDFLGMPLTQRMIPSVNEKPDLHGNRKPPFADWDQASRQAFDRLCGKTMMTLGYV